VREQEKGVGEPSRKGKTTKTVLLVFKAFMPWMNWLGAGYQKFKGGSLTKVPRTPTEMKKKIKSLGKLCI